MTKSRLRNLALPMGLAAAAAILIGIYVVSYRNSVTHGAALVKVVVATRDIPAGTDGSTIAGGGYLKSQTVPRRSVVPGSITTAASLTSKVTATEIFKGEQITLRQFVPIAQGGIFSKFSGTQRLVVVPGDPNQLLSGTVSDGDHIDVIVTSKYKVNDLARTIARDTLRNILVLKAPDGSKPTASVGGPPVTTATLVMTDRQAQKMAWALKFGAFMFILRPTDKPRDNSPSIDTFYSVFGQGLPNASHQLLGDFPESIDAQP